MIKRAYRNRPLTKEDKAFNQIQSRIRSTLESVVEALKLYYAMGKARYFGLGRNRTRVEIMCVAYNTNGVYRLSRRGLPEKGKYRAKHALIEKSSVLCTHFVKMSKKLNFNSNITNKPDSSKSIRINE